MSAPVIAVRIEVRGGLVQRVVSDAADWLDAVIVDYDNDAEDALATSVFVEVDTDPAIYREGAP